MESFVEKLNLKTVAHNTEKSQGNLRKLAVTQTPVRKHQLTLVEKNKLIRVKIIIN